MPWSERQWVGRWVVVTAELTARNLAGMKAVKRAVRLVLPKVEKSADWRVTARAHLKAVK